MPQEYIQNMKSNINTRNVYPSSSMQRLKPSNSCMLPNNNYTSNNSLNSNIQNLLMFNRNLDTKLRLIEKKMHSLEQKSIQMERMNNIAMQLLPKNILPRRNNNNNMNNLSSYPQMNNNQSMCLPRTCNTNPMKKVTIQKPNISDGLNNEIVKLRNELLSRFERINKKQKLQMAGILYVISNFKSSLDNIIE